MTRLNTQIVTSGGSTVTKFGQHVDQLDMNAGRKNLSLRSGDIITYRPHDFDKFLYLLVWES